MPSQVLLSLFICERSRDLAPRHLQAIVDIEGSDSRGGVVGCRRKTARDSLLEVVENGCDSSVSVGTGEEIELGQDAGDV